MKKSVDKEKKMVYFKSVKQKKIRRKQMIFIYLLDLLFAVPIILGLIALSKKFILYLTPKKVKEKKNENDN